MADTAPLLRLDIREKRFGTATVLSNLSVSVQAGELVALVGPSGCGKSTGLMIAAGLDTDFAGDRQLAPGARIAVQFQEPDLLPWRDLVTNVDLALPRERRGRGVAQHWLNEVGLPAPCHRQFPGEVSLGMQRRAALARTLAADGDLLLLDEPLVSLDTALAQRLRMLLLRRMVERQGLGMLMVTHDLEEAAQMADRILMLSPHPAGLVRELAPEGARGQRSSKQLAMTVEHIHTLLQQLTTSRLHPILQG